MDIYSKIAELQRNGEAVALATVVSRQAPVSSHLGDKALVFEDGRFEGYVGGSCSREIVRKQALEALRLGRPRLVRITPEAAARVVLEHADEVMIPMTCASEGAVDVYIEPLVGKASLLVVGGSQIALCTAQIAARMNYRVTLACDMPELAGVSLESDIQVLNWRELPDWLAHQNPAKTSIVVASQGHYDEDALALIAASMPNPAYLGLVASRKRGATVLDNLELLGVPKTTFPQLKYPAGLDLGGRGRDEVAISILAEIILQKSGKQGFDGRLAMPEKTPVVAPNHSRSAPHPGVPEEIRQVASIAAEIGASAAAAPANLPPGTAIDPTSGEVLEIAKAVSAEYQGQTYYFSCPNCRAKFLKNPEKYLKGRA
ncbi:MAG: XdhC family protein [Meiothermus sp.]|nr:XdhC family protein [Meiothermus sp.]